MSDKMKEYIEKYEALQAMWNALYELEDHRGLDWFARMNMQDGFEAGQGVIANFPAADVVEVRHGRWVNIVHATVDTTGYCDKCHSQSVWRTRDRAYEICPRCGAKMDGYHDGLKRALFVLNTVKDVDEKEEIR